jgi:Protein of unknown function (DUF2516)
VLLLSLDILVLKVLYGLAIPVGLFAFIHAARQRADAYTATDKLTKPAWLGITGGGTIALMLCFPWNEQGIFSTWLMFWLIGLVAVLVYLVDVKPAVTEVQRGPRW